MSLNRNFSAPVRVVANQSGDDLRFLAAHDSDPFNRWQALQSLATRLLVDNVAAIRSGGAARSDDGLLDALAAILADTSLEPAFVSLALTLPSEADIAREIARDVDPDAIFTARTALREAAGQHLAAALQDRYRALTDAGPYRPDAAGAGRRALRNTCLDLMVAARGAGRDRARRAAISRRRQHDRSHGRAHDAVAAATCPNAPRRSTISTSATRTTRW